MVLLLEESMQNYLIARRRKNTCNKKNTSICVHMKVSIKNTRVHTHSHIEKLLIVRILGVIIRKVYFSSV